MKDVILMALAGLAEIEPAADTESTRAAEGEFGPGVTLLVSGMLVSGYIVSKKKYMGHHPIVTEIQRIREEHEAEMSTPDDGESESPLPDCIHLRDAKCFAAGGNPIPGNTGVFWRISLDAVQGFTFGVLAASGVS